MDLNQRKLVKSEWETIEIPVSQPEKEVLSLIIQGFHNVNIKYNKHQSLLSYLKIEYNEVMEDYLFTKYFCDIVKQLSKDYSFPSIATAAATIKPNTTIKKADMIRLEKNSKEKLNSSFIFEYLLVEWIEKILKLKTEKKALWLDAYFTLYKISKSSIHHLNRHMESIVGVVLKEFDELIDIKEMVKKSVDLIEKNEVILKYGDMQLYEHQKQIFNITQNPKFQERIDNLERAKQLEKELERENEYAERNDIEPRINESMIRALTSAIPIVPKIVLYIAPTGTGKTLSPIGISEKNRVIFVCAARHVGLALARAAISVNKKIAFAFGCASADDIRLHYFAAKDYTVNKKSGGIGKVDNSVGDKVEIMICDLKSYLPAMYYMKAFNPIENIVVYWDEPTITLDYEEHELHEIIQKNWSENLIPTMILSSATLPKLHELNETIADFKKKFPGAMVHNIVSHDCKKTIPIINKNGYVVLPHFLSENFEEVLSSVSHCTKNLTLLRYMDLKEIVDFIIYVEENNFVPSSSKIERQFASLDDVDMQSIKIHYLKIIQKINSEEWLKIYQHFNYHRMKRIMPNNKIDTKGNQIRKVPSVGAGVSNKSSSDLSGMAGKPLIKTKSEQILRNCADSTPSQNNGADEQCAIYISTKDAYTLTDGPTIFLANDIEKIAKFYIQQANIPTIVMEDIMKKIDCNNSLNEKIVLLEQKVEEIVEKRTMKEKVSDGSIEAKKMKSEPKMRDKEIGEKDVDYHKTLSEIEMYRSMIKPAELNETFIPNKPLHLKKWAENMGAKNAFTSDIDETTIVDIMMLNDVDDTWKILLLMGIGVFTNHKSIAYTEIMKKLAEKQRLYMIIASSDYIYGTNYQFCHGYLSKDMTLTQEKTIQALGRIGRNNIQQNYSIRFRDDEQIRKIFYEEEDKPEVANMNRLFSTP